MQASYLADSTEPERYDVVIVGAGFAGLYALHKVKELSFSAILFEAGEGVGGTWFWNRYPGARCDVPSMEYSYSFSDELQREWDWSEVMAGQPEIERYLNYVADKFELRPNIRLGARVAACTFDDGTNRWTVETESGVAVQARFCIMATGCLSAPLKPEFRGMETFLGVAVQTSKWPRNGVALDGKHVALIGTGSSGVQVAPELAQRAATLTVFQRTATYTWPAINRALEQEEREAIRREYPSLRRRQRTSVRGVAGPIGGALQEPAQQSLLGLSQEERQAALDQHGFAFTRMFSDVLTDSRANELARSLYGQMVRRVVKDCKTAAALAPADYPLGCKRHVMDLGYFEMFNRSTVSLVDLRDDPIVEVKPGGIRTCRSDHAFDVIVYATGFDAISGALTRIDIRGRNGLSLQEKWASGALNYLGLMIAGFPNLFTVTGPGSPGPLTNVVISIEQHIEWIADCLINLRERGATTIEASFTAEASWVEHVNALAAASPYTAPGCKSWYLGANVPGKKRQFMPYAAGLGAYSAECAAIAAADYEGFIMHSECG